MEGPSLPLRLVRFGRYELDLKARVLRAGKRKIDLQEKPFQLLAALVERPRELVTREELRQKLWPDGTFVEFEDNLNHAVNKLREALNDSARHPRFVETVPRQGYRFVAPIETPPAASARSLAELLRDAKPHRLPLGQILRVAEQVSSALDLAHRSGIPHQALVPENVWLMEDGSVLLEDCPSRSGRSLPPGAAPAPYMAPEQALGQWGPRSDLYSLGAMLYEMSTGRTPFPDDGAVSHHLPSPLAAPSSQNPEIPPSLDSLVLRLLARDPLERPENAAVVREDLRAISASVEAIPPNSRRARLLRWIGGIFVGRERELEDLDAALQDAFMERARVMLLVGEPGSGKTRTAGQFVQRARLRQAQVLLGRCHEGEGAPAFWPWIQILRSYAHEREPDELLSMMGPGAADIAGMDSELSGRLPALPRPPSFVEPEQAWFRLFDSITTFLKNVSQVQPVVLILDDLHRGDKASLLLLEFLSRELHGTRTLIVGTYRDVELGRDHALAQTLAELARSGVSERIVLSGLSLPEVGHFIEMAAGFKPPKSLVAAVYEQTEGNPFFVNEVLRLLIVEGRLESEEEMTSSSIPIPQGVREVIGRRVACLSNECGRVLQVAAVMGREFDVRVLERVCGLSVQKLSEVLDEAAGARILTTLPGTAGHGNFVHALIRETIHDETPTSHRVRLHRQVAEAYEAIYSSRREDHFPKLAYHFFQAGPSGDLGKAVHYSALAGRRATGQLAYEEAVSHYETALQALSLNRSGDEELRCDLLLSLSDAKRRTGDREKAREILREAADIARRLGSAELMARAALGFRPRLLAAIPEDSADEFQVGLLSETLRALGEQDSALRAKVLAHLSVALYFKASPAERGRLSQEALDVARRVGDHGALATALSARHSALVAPESLEERLSIANEMVRISSEAGEKEKTLRGHHRRLLALLEQGDIRAVEDGVETYAELADELRQPFYLWYTPFCRASLALLRGRFEECERLAQQALAIGRRSEDPMAVMWFWAQSLVMSWQRGPTRGLERQVRKLVEKYPSDPAWRAGLAKLYCELGRPAQAQAGFDRLAINDFADLPRYAIWLFAVAQLADVCAFLGDSRRARSLYDLLLPYAGRNVVMGSVPMSLGPVSRYLGLLSSTLSRWEEAARHFERSLEMNQRMEARPFLAHTQHDYAKMLLARGQPGDREKAHELLGAALDAAKEMGMKKLHRVTREILDQLRDRQ
jgi:predicted ATPase/DNA-binding winged helix-turn-helix (wHTH) protein